ncbi:unnamed protein product [Prunus armeniaca]
MQHDCKKEDFKELIGFVSISALDNIMVELKWLDYIGVDPISCGCIIKHTHGLPCAHEMQEFKRTHRPIPLDCIHPRWRKLDFLEPRPTATLNNPPENALAHLIDNVVTRPPRKKPKTIPQKRSVFNSQTQPLPYVNPKKRPSKLPVYRPKPIVDDSCLTLEFNKSFPKHILIHIRGAQDVKSDGNCGFRAIGSLMGFGDNSWRKVRRDLLKELRKESVIYELILNGKERVQHIEYMLDYFEDFPLQDRWMTIPDMGHLFASCYNVYLEGQHPMPPVDERWLRCVTITASDWLTPYQDRIRQFRYEAGVANPYDNDPNLLRSFVDIPSYCVGLVLKNCQLPYANHGNIILADPSQLKF